jgi:2-polyprenyl-3-methyl-5-hydroxy-6-metoxy-1,4-benzoquinol methylase
MTNETYYLCGAQRVEALTDVVRRCRACEFLYVTNDERARQQAEFLTEQPATEERMRYLRKKYPKDTHKKAALYDRFANEVLALVGPEPTLLDVGANGGFFMRAFEKRGVPKEHFQCLEISNDYIQLAHEYFGYPSDRSNIETFKPNTRFDVVSFMDCLEHVADFEKALTNVHHMLNENGLVVLKLPNGRWTYLKYLFAKLTRQEHKIDTYLYIEPGGHLNYWSLKNIDRLERYGFKVLQKGSIKPTKEQFGRSYPLRMLFYALDRLLGTKLFPEFYAYLRKSES